MHLRKGEWALAIFNVLYLIIFAIYFLSIQNYEFIFYIAVIFVIATVIILTLKDTKFNYLALWGLSIWNFLHMLGGSLPIGGGKVLYNWRIIELINKGGDFYILKMDQVIHFYGFFVAAIIVYQLISNLFPKGHLKRTIFLAWLGSMGLGALNEVIEFLAFITLSNTGVGDMYNTGFDLVFNMLGAFCGALLANYLSKK